MVMYIIIGLAIFLGITFKIHNNLRTEDVMTAIYLASFTGMTAGISALFFPDVGAAKQSLERLFALL